MTNPNDSIPNDSVGKQQSSDFLRYAQNNLQPLLWRDVVVSVYMLKKHDYYNIPLVDAFSPDWHPRITIEISTIANALDSPHLEPYIRNRDICNSLSNIVGIALIWLDRVMEQALTGKDPYILLVDYIRRNIFEPVLTDASIVNQNYLYEIIRNAGTIARHQYILTPLHISVQNDILKLASTCLVKLLEINYERECRYKD